MFPEFKKVGTGLRPGKKMVKSMQCLPLCISEMCICCGERGVHKPFQHSMVRGKGQVLWDHSGTTPNRGWQRVGKVREGFSEERHIGLGPWRNRAAGRESKGQRRGRAWGFGGLHVVRGAGGVCVETGERERENGVSRAQAAEGILHAWWRSLPFVLRAPDQVCVLKIPLLVVAWEVQWRWQDWMVRGQRGDFCWYLSGWERIVAWA